MPKVWSPYTEQKSYLKIKSDLINPTTKRVEFNDANLRDELYKIWTHEDVTNNQTCQSYHNQSIPYNPRQHTNGRNEPLERCFAALGNSTEYIYLGEHFLIEYEKCVEVIEEKSFHSLSSTACLDVIAVRRLIIEHQLCCQNNDTYITSTLCSFKNFDINYVDYNLTSLARLVSVNQPPDFSGFNPLSVPRISFLFSFIFFLLRML